MLKQLAALAFAALILTLHAVIMPHCFLISAMRQLLNYGFYDSQAHKHFINIHMAVVTDLILLVSVGRLGKNLNSLSTTPERWLKDF